ncbi:MAG: hypothetical protein KAS32_26385 [Candidatus Peribacteraceae bacterium]|nr:hypothetical protein [Candidatus Peribacteraceae bacterium]
MSKQKRSKAVRPITKHQQQQRINVELFQHMDKLNSLIQGMIAKVEVMSGLAQQTIITLLILKEKGFITDAEIEERREQLMQPVGEGISSLGDKVSSGASETETGGEETVDSENEKTGDVGSTDTDGDASERVPESSEIQSEDIGTIEGDVGSTKLRLSDDQSEGGNRSSGDCEIKPKSSISSDVPESTDPSPKANNFSLD